MVYAVPVVLHRLTTAKREAGKFFEDKIVLFQISLAFEFRFLQRVSTFSVFE